MKKFFALVLAAMMMLGCISLASAEEKVTLVVWDTHTDAEKVRAIEAIDALFVEKYPNVTIERVAKDLDAMSSTLKPAFMAGDAPDVIYHEMGIGEMGDYVKAGYLMELTDEYEKYGWNDTIMAVSHEVPSVPGIIYGVGSEVESMGLYYNKTILAELGLEVPKTVEELTAAMQVAVDAGYIGMGNTLDQYWHTNMNFVGTILYAFMSQEEIQATMMEDASWDIPSVRAAIDTIQLWLDKGYFPDHPEVYTEQQVMFALGESVFWVTGNWSIGQIAEVADEGFEYGIIPFPGSETCPDGGSQVNYVGSGYMVNNATEIPDVALAYVDFVLNTPEAAKIWYEEAKIIPPYKGDCGAEINEYSQMVMDSLTSADVSNIAGINMWLGANSFEFYSHVGQNLAVDAYDTEGFIAGVEEARLKDVEQKGTKGTFSLE